MAEGDEFESFVVARFPDGSVIQRYIQGGEYWHVHPEGRGFPGARVPMKRAADRVVWQGGEVVPGVPAAKRFYKAVELARIDWLAERADRAARGM